MTPEEAVDEFDRAARTAAGPSHAQVEVAMWAVAETEGKALDFWLDGLADLCGAGDDRVALGYGAAVAGLAPHLPPPTDRMVLAAVEVELAWLDACADRWLKAVQRLRRSEHDVVELVPACRGRWEQVMAGVAEHEDRDADAVAHLRRAEDAFAAEGQWGEAGESAAGRARVHNRSADDRMRDLRDAAAFFTVAERPDDVREAVEEAVALVGHAHQEYELGAGEQVERLAAAAREIALAHGFRRWAADVGVTGNSPGVFSSTVSWATLRARIEGLRTEYWALPEHADVGRRQLAVLDMQEGLGAFVRNRRHLAEPLLVRALTVFRVEGMTDEVGVCEEYLGHMPGMNGGPVTRSPAPDATHGGRSALHEALPLMSAGRHAEARVALDRAVRLFHDAGEVATAAFVEALGGLLALGLGDHTVARRAAATARSHAAAAPGPSRFHSALGWLAGWLDAELAGVDGDRPRHLRGLERIEQDMLAADEGVGAAHVAMRRAHLVLTAGRGGAALEVALPALLAIDAARTALPDATRRRSWAAQVAHGFDTAFRSAVAAGRLDVVAELLEVARGNGVPLPRAVDDRTDAASAFADLLTPANDPDPGTGAPGPPQATLSGASAVAGAERTALGVPASLRTPWGTVALAKYLERARRYRDPVRAEVTAEWRVPA